VTKNASNIRVIENTDNFFIAEESSAAEEHTLLS
jgi:hypothetical protein